MSLPVVQYGQYDVPQVEKCACLNVGQPANSHLPLTDYNKALLAVATNTNPASLQYGHIPGYEDFRGDFAEFLSRAYTEDYRKFAEVNGLEESPITVDQKNLIMTNGNTGGLQLLLSLYGKTGMTIFVEDPTYFLALDSFTDLKLKVKAIKVDNFGLVVTDLEDAIRLEDPNQTCLLYTIPINHNPTGYTMSEGRRMHLSGVACTYPNLLVFADEVYHMLNFSGDDNLFPMCYYHKNFISMGSFSKIFAPALRMGWIQSMNQEIVNKILGCGQLDSSGCTNPIGCTIAHHIIKSGDLSKSIVNWQQFLKMNCESLYLALTENLQEHIEKVERPRGGYFLWVQFKPYVNTVELSKIMEQYRVKFHHGNKFSSSKTANNFMRLSFSWYCSEGDYLVAVQRLKKLIDENCVATTTAISSKDVKPVEQHNIVYVLGYKGRLGSLIAQKVQSSTEFVYGGGLDRNLILDNVNSSSIIVDVSSPTGTENLLRKLLEQNIYCKVIIGTTGTLPIDLIEQYSKFAPIAISSNFSKGISQFKKIISVIEKDTWIANIVEKHHIMKKDSPSGTAKLLAKYYGYNCIPLESIYSVREGELFGEHHLTLTSPIETIRISHVAKSRELFAFGSLNWIKWIRNQKLGLYEDIHCTQNVYSEENKIIVTGCVSKQFKDILSVIDNSWQVESQDSSDDATNSTVILSNDYEYIRIQHMTKHQNQISV